MSSIARLINSEWQAMGGYGPSALKSGFGVAEDGGSVMAVRHPFFYETNNRPLVIDVLSQKKAIKILVSFSPYQVLPRLLFF